MVTNRFMQHMFPDDTSLESADSFDLSSKKRRQRMHEIITIARHNHVFKGFTPQRFRAMLEELGPSFVKIGQTLSMRSEILPKAYCDELTHLQADCDPLPTAEILAAIDEQYHGRTDEIFEYIDSKPLGSASLAQVHRARLRTGEDVAIKIQRPGVRYTMALDIDIMRTLTRHASHFIKGPQIVDLQGVVEEMWGTFLQETDFLHEAANLKEFRRLNALCRYVDAPQVYDEYCTQYVLVMEYVDGIPIHRTKELVKAGYDLEDIGVKLLDNYAKQILTDGFFHGDPHPGNIFIRGGTIVYIDLGIMGRLTRSDQMRFGDIIKAVGVSSGMALKDALLNFSVSPPPADLDHARLLSDLDTVLRQYTSTPIKDLDMGTFLNNILALTTSYGIEMPSSFTNVARGLLTIQGTVTPLLTHHDIASILYDHMQRSQDPFTHTQDMLRTAALDSRGMAVGLRDSAIYSGEMMRMLTRGHFKMNMEMLGSEELFQRLSRIMFRVTLSVIIAGVLIGSALLALTDMEPQVLGIPLVALIGLISAFALSVWEVFDLWRSRPKP